MPWHTRWSWSGAELYVTQDFLQKSPNTAKAILRVMIKATDFINGPVVMPRLGIESIDDGFM